MDWVEERVNAGGRVVVDYNLQRYVPVPVAGEEAVTAVTDRTDTAVLVRWLDAAGAAIESETPEGSFTFALGAAYRADITRTAREGYAFDPAVSFAYPAGTVAAQPEANTGAAVRALTTVVYKATAAPFPVDDRDLTYKVPAPAAGATPVLAFAAAGYTGTVAWKDGGADVSGLFEPGKTTYTAAVTLYASAGYTLPATGYSHSGGDVGSVNTNPAAGDVTLTITFTEATGDNPWYVPPVQATDLNLAPYIPAPATGAAPALSFAASSYVGIVEWYPGVSGFFAADTEYTAKATLYPLAGFTFEGIPAMPSPGGAFFHSQSASVTHEAGAAGSPLEVTIDFDRTLLIPVTNRDLAPYVPSPVTGGTPVRSFYAAGYWGAVTWKKTADSAPHSGVFEASTLYTATVTLTAEPGYTIDGLPFTYGIEPLGTPPTVTIDFDRTLSAADPYLPFSGLPGVNRDSIIDLITGGGGVNVAGGTFTMNGGTVRDNTATSDRGGGVYVNSGTFNMNGGTISGNTGIYGGGVYVAGTFTMTGGTISGNTAQNGGGVYLQYGTFTMSGTAAVSGNTATSAGGGGVYMSASGSRTSGTFVMNGGAVRDNTAAAGSGGGVLIGSNGKFYMNRGTVNGNTAASGGGVYFESGTFEMSGTSAVSGNKAQNGGGVYAKRVFTMSGGTVSGNTADTSGGGMYFEDAGTTSSTSPFTLPASVIVSGNYATAGGGVYVNGGYFTLKGIVRENVALDPGGGVYVYGGTFTLSGGTVNNNTAQNGGGVCVYNGGAFTLSVGTVNNNTAAVGGGVFVASGTFTKSGGTIYGTDGGANANAASMDGQGHAVYAADGSKYRDSTAGPSDDLDSSETGTAGGWDDPEGV
jgi:hypothetical protein